MFLPHIRFSLRINKNISSGEELKKKNPTNRGGNKHTPPKKDIIYDKDLEINPTYVCNHNKYKCTKLCN